jgi:hypothetical protein
MKIAGILILLLFFIIRRNEGSPVPSIVGKFQSGIQRFTFFGGLRSCVTCVELVGLFLMVEIVSSNRGCAVRRGRNL